AVTFKATLVRDTGNVSELVGAELSFTANDPVSFGAACGGRIDSSGTPLAGSDSFGFTLGQARPNAPAVLLVGSGRDATPLDAIGMPGCALHVLLGSGAPVIPLSTSSSGSAEVPVPLPANPVAFTGKLVAQFVYLAPG